MQKIAYTIVTILSVGLLFLLIMSAGNPMQPDTGTITPVPTILPSGAKFVKGDIIAMKSSSAGQFMMILNYDTLTGTYERASVRRTSDGSWYRINDKSESVNRTLIEKIYPVRVDHVTSLAQVPVTAETPPSTLPQETEKNNPTIPVTRDTRSLSATVPAARIQCQYHPGKIPPHDTVHGYLRLHRSGHVCLGY